MAGYDPVRDAGVGDSPAPGAPPLDPVPPPDSAPAPRENGGARPRPYQPAYRVSEPDSILRPITPAEIEERKRQSRNPLRMPHARARAAVRKRPEDEVSSAEVAEHYNKRRDVGVVAREESPIIPLRRFNNWIKSALIMLHTPQNAQIRVLDLGGGKGGDLRKWDRQRPMQLVLVDIAQMSVEAARQRYEQMHARWSAHFFTFDCFAEPLDAHMPQDLLDPLFDAVSLQFCLHYGWDSEEHARQMIENVARWMRPGGVFLGTIPDAETLYGRLHALPGDDEVTFGNDIYRVEFTQRDPPPGGFGHTYRFWLLDAVDDVPEHVVDWDTLVDLCAQCGLRPVYHARFDQILARGYTHPELQKLMVRNKVIDAALSEAEGVVSPAVPPSMWDVCTLYAGFVFEKVDEAAAAELAPTAEPAPEQEPPAV